MVLLVVWLVGRSVGLPLFSNRAGIHISMLLSEHLLNHEAFITEELVGVLGNAATCLCTCWVHSNNVIRLSVYGNVIANN